MPFQDQDLNIDTLSLNAQQLYEKLTSAEDTSEDELEDLKAFAEQLAQATVLAMLKNSNSVEELRTSVEDLIVITRLLEQSRRSSQEEIAQLNNIQTWLKKNLETIQRGGPRNGLVPPNG